MSKTQICYTCHEIILDDNGNFIKEYEENLPHHNQIEKEMCDSFNNTHIERFFDGILKDKIKSAIMTFKKIDNKSVGIMTIEGIPNFRFTQKVRDEIYEQIGGQLSDGWGEGFFGYINVMTAPDGTKFIVE